MASKYPSANAMVLSVAQSRKMGRVTRSIQTFLVAGLVVFATVACTLASPAPPQFVNRPALRSCGDEVYGQNDEPNIAARQCLLTAFQQREPAELASTQPTVEGDPTKTYYRVWPNESVPIELFHDASRDRFRSSSWTYSICEDLAHTDDDQTFQVIGCRAEVLVE